MRVASTSPLEVDVLAVDQLTLRPLSVLGWPGRCTLPAFECWLAKSERARHVVVLAVYEVF